MSRRAAATLALVFVLTLALTAGSSRAAVSSAQTEIPDSEYQALVALYNATDGPTWGPARGWMLDDSPCSWGGVTCEEGHVTGLDVGGFGLSGHLVSELENLTYLAHFYAGFNYDLTGSIPPELGNLDNLQLLVLNNCAFTGQIPAELASLSNLQYISLLNNSLSGPIPPDFGNLTEMIQFSISGSGITGSIPSELGNWSHLDKLEIVATSITGSIPPELGNLSNVTLFWLSNNNLTGAIPPELGNLSRVRQLHLDGNPLSGPIPLSFMDLTNLYSLDLDHTALCVPDDPDFQAWLDGFDPSKLPDNPCSEGNSTLHGRVVEENGQTLNILSVQIDIAPWGKAETQIQTGCFAQPLPPGTYTLTPAKDGYWFAPPSRQAVTPPDAIGLDFVAYPCAAPSDLDVCDLQPGDILLARLGAPADEQPFSAGNSYFTHAALFLGTVAAPVGDPTDLRPRIAEAATPDLDAADQVRELWLTDSLFWSGEGVLDWAVVRPDATAAVKSAAIALARDRAADPAVVCNRRAAKDDDAGTYCAKLVWRAYRDVADGVDLEADRDAASGFGADWVTPDDLWLGSPQVQSGETGAPPTGRWVGTLWSPAHLTLIDPEGHRAGYDPDTGGLLAEIPGAWYAAPPDVDIETLTASGVGAGWQVQVTGIGDGAYVYRYRYLDGGTMTVTRWAATAPDQVEIYAVRDPATANYLPWLGQGDPYARPTPTAALSPTLTPTPE